MAGILFIISAPSGSGKSTLVSELRKQVSGVDFAVSWTTRAPRGSEENGREYNFTTREEFERMIDAGEFLEHAEVFGNYYGTARQSLEDARSAGHDLLLDIDVQGAAQVRAKMPEAVSIFVLPPNPKVLRTRLRNRSRAEGVVDEAEGLPPPERGAARRLRIIASTDIFWSTTFWTGRWRNWRPLCWPSATTAMARPSPTVRAGCWRWPRPACRRNSQERLKPVLEAFGVGDDSGQQQQLP